MGKRARKLTKRESAIQPIENRLDGYTSLRESSTRKKIDQWLLNLGWITDEESPRCNVTTERALTREQKTKLLGKEPDYLLYKSGTHHVIAAIEAKAKGENLDKALKEAIEKYARPLKIPTVFVTDGSFFRTWHHTDEKPLRIDSEPVNQLLGESTLLRFISSGSSIL